MKRKGLLIIILILTAVVLFAGCGSAGAPPLTESGSGNIVSGSTQRKIIYTYHCNIYTDDLEESIGIMTAALAGLQDAYIESSSKTSNSQHKTAAYTFRIKSEDLNGFIAALSGAGQVNDENLKTADVTEEYFDLEAQKAAKLAEEKRLFELYQLASDIGSLDNISRRIAEVQAELNKINSAIANYDSLVALSSVTVNLYQSKPTEKNNFGTKLALVFKNAGKAIAVFFEYVLYALIYIVPFAATGAAVFFAVRLIRKKARTKKEKNMPKPTQPDN